MHYFVKTALLTHLFIQKASSYQFISVLLPPSGLQMSLCSRRQSGHRAGILKWAIKPNGGYINPRVLILFLLINRVTGQYSQIKNTFIMKMHQFNAFSVLAYLIGANDPCDIGLSGQSRHGEDQTLVVSGQTPNL